MVDLEKITSEIRAILPDVTPGPWYQTSEPWFSSGDGVLAGSPDGNVAYLIADCDDFALPRDEYDGPFQLGDRDRDAAYIALCSPDNIGALLAERAADRATIASLRSKLAEARAANERDRTEVCMAVNSLSDAFARRDWLMRGGRGSYEWDDDRFRDEFRDAMAEFEPHIDRLRKIGADRTNCPETQAEVRAARAALAARDGRHG